MAELKCILCTCIFILIILLDVLAFRSNPKKDYPAARKEDFVFRVRNIPKGVKRQKNYFDTQDVLDIQDYPEEVVNEPTLPKDTDQVHSHVHVHVHGSGHGHGGAGLGNIPEQGHGDDDGHEHDHSKEDIASDQNAEEPANFNVSPGSGSLECEENGIQDKYTFVALIDIVFVDGCKRTCTGAIIHDNVVITAAHCFTMVRDQFAQPELSLSFVVIGTKRMFETGYEQYLPIERVVTHPRFRGWTADLALVFTFANMDSDKPGKVLPLYLERSSVPVDSNVTVFSWGKCNSDIDSKEKNDPQNKLTYYNNKIGSHKYKEKDNRPDHHYKKPNHNKPAETYKKHHEHQGGHSSPGSGVHGDQGDGVHDDQGDGVHDEQGDGVHDDQRGEVYGDFKEGDPVDGDDIEIIIEDDIKDAVTAIPDTKMRVNKLNRPRGNPLLLKQRRQDKKGNANDDRNTRRGHKVDDIVKPAVEGHKIVEKVKTAVESQKIVDKVKTTVGSHKIIDEVEPAVQSFFDLQDYDGQNFVSLKSNSTYKDMGDEPFLEMIKKSITKTNETSHGSDSVRFDNDAHVNKKERRINSRRNLQETLANLTLKKSSQINKNVRYIRDYTTRKVRRQMPRVHHTHDFQYYNNWRRTIGQQHNNLSVGMFGYVNIASCKKTIERTLPPMYEIDNKHEYLCYSSEEFYITNEDSGAPVVQRDELVAITVGGIDNEGDHIAVGLKIACFCNWIAFHLPNHDGAKLHCCHGCCVDHSKHHKGQNDDQYQVTPHRNRHRIRVRKKSENINQYYQRHNDSKSPSKKFEPNDANYRIAFLDDGNQFENQPEFADKQKKI